MGVWVTAGPANSNKADGGEIEEMYSCSLAFTPCRVKYTTVLLQSCNFLGFKQGLGRNTVGVPEHEVCQWAQTRLVA